MTPDQVSKTIELAIAQRDTRLLLWLVIAMFLTWVLWFFIEYLKEKGKNFATKEDISAITDKIESTKAVYTEKIESLKIELASRSHFSKLRYEREMEIYRVIWSALVELRATTLTLRPFYEFRPVDETQETWKVKKLEAFHKTLIEFYKAWDVHRPFYPHDIWKELYKLSNLTHKESIDYSILEGCVPPLESLKQAEENRDQILTLIENICETIRNRLALFDPISN